MDNVEQTINGLLDSARINIETALSLGREHNVSVDLTKLGIAEDMWYVDETDYRETYLEDNYGVFNAITFSYDIPELTEEQLAEVEEHMEEIRKNGGYDGGYKVLGWMSSSTNC